MTQNTFFVLIFICVATLQGCASQSAPHVRHQPVIDMPPDTPLPIEINVFSSYLTEEGEAACQSGIPASYTCKNDGIPASDFLNAITSLNLFKNLSPSVSRYDYELLIGNQLTQPPQGDVVSFPRKSITEFTVEWRGVPIDTFSVEYWHSENSAIVDSQVNQIVLNWWQHAQQQAIFSTEYLYAAMGASNYDAQLNLPTSLNAFQLSKQYTYPDPFRGIIARYTHPEFEDAILDIAVYPILASLTAQPLDIVKTELKKAVDTANEVAKARAMAVTMQQVSKPFQSDFLPNNGIMAEMSAEDDNGESLFASIYIFKLEDKFVKFSTTFPSRIGDPLIHVALSQLQVPPESSLMKEIRQALK